jgi:hypothetical protein
MVETRRSAQMTLARPEPVEPPIFRERFAIINSRITHIQFGNCTEVGLQQGFKPNSFAIEFNGLL